MPLFPLFIELKDKKCVVIGGGNVAERKIETLLGFNAAITVISPKVTESLIGLKKDAKIKHYDRGYISGDIEGAFLVIAATSDEMVNKKVYEDSISRGIYVNVVDNPELCTFVFPAIVKKGKIVVGTTTSGSYPALSKKIRKLIEDVIPEISDDKLELLNSMRKRVIKQIKNPEKRKELMNIMLEIVISNDDELSFDNLKRKLENLIEEYKHEEID